MAKHVQVEIQTHTVETEVCDICGSTLGSYCGNAVAPYGSASVLVGGKMVDASYQFNLAVDGAPVRDICGKCMKTIIENIVTRYR